MTEQKLTATFELEDADGRGEIISEGWPNEPTLLVCFDRPGGTASMCNAANWTLEQASRALLALSTELAIQAGADNLAEVDENSKPWSDDGNS